MTCKLRIEWLTVFNWSSEIKTMINLTIPQLVLIGYVGLQVVLLLLVFLTTKSTLKEVWARNSTYRSAFTHSFDMASDVALMIEFYQLGISDSSTSYWNPLKLAIAMLAINITYRIVSSVQIYLSTKKLSRSRGQAIKAAFLQLLDLLLIHEAYVAFRQKRTQPTVKQVTSITYVYRC